MGRLLSPGDHCRAVDVPFGRSARYDGTVVEVADPVHYRALRKAGYTPADTAGTPIRQGGFECAECSFKSFFRLCSRCGGTCERPDVAA